MRTNRFFLPLLSAVAGLGLSASALAHDDPSSLLVFPEFDSSIGSSTVITVTNTSDDAVNGNITVHYRYIDSRNCLEFDRNENLTANDTLTVLAAFHNPDQVQGFLYVYAQRNGVPISFNHLIGQELTLNAFVLFNYAYNPFNFKAIPAEGSPTNVAPADNLRNFNNQEYEQAPDALLVPRFFGQDVIFDSHLVLLNLEGGKNFETIVDFLVYNNNEVQLSAQYQFRCWTKVDLDAISGVFDNTFLNLFTDIDIPEVLGLLGIHAGWFKVDGNVAFSSADSIEDPAILGVLDETFGPFGAADLPYALGRQDGDLLGTSIFHTD